MVHQVEWGKSSPKTLEEKEKGSAEIQAEESVAMHILKWEEA